MRRDLATMVDTGLPDVTELSPGAVEFWLLVLAVVVGCGVFAMLVADWWTGRRPE